MLMTPHEDRPGAEIHLDRIADGFVAYDRDFRVTYVNRAAEAYFGLGREDMLGRVNWELFPASVGSETQRQLMAAAAGREPVEFELLTPTHQRWVSFRCFPDADCLRVYFRDITAQKQARDALRESEARFRAMFENSLDGVLLTSPAGEIFSANPAACSMLGRSEAELCRGGRSLIADAGDPNLKTFIEERHRRGQARGELTLVHADGTKIPAEVASAIFRTGDGADRTSMILHDLRPQKRAERVLRLLLNAGAVLAESLDYETTIHNLTRLVVPELADLCVIHVVEGGVTRRVAMVDRDGAVDGPLSELARRSAGRPAATAIRRVLRTGQPELVPEITEAWLREATGDEAHLAVARALGETSVLVVPIAVRGQVSGVMSLAIRGHERRFSADDLPLAQGLADRAGLAIDKARLYASALDAKRLRDEMLGIVSHDLRSPLNAIHLAAQVLARRGDGQELTTIRRSILRANRLVEDLLTTAMIDGGSLPLKKRGQSRRGHDPGGDRAARPVAEAHGLEKLEISVRRGPAPACTSIATAWSRR